MLSSTLAYAERFASVKNPNVTEEIRKCALQQRCVTLSIRTQGWGSMHESVQS